MQAISRLSLDYCFLGRVLHASKPDPKDARELATPGGEEEVQCLC